VLQVTREVPSLYITELQEIGVLQVGEKVSSLYISDLSSTKRLMPITSSENLQQRMKPG